MNKDLKLKRSRCTKCNSVRSYSNPLAKCHECGKKFCYDHIWAGYAFPGIRSYQEFANICDDCKAGTGVTLSVGIIEPLTAKVSK